MKKIEGDDWNYMFNMDFFEWVKSDTTDYHYISKRYKIGLMRSVCYSYMEIIYDHAYKSKEDLLDRILKDEDSEEILFHLDILRKYLSP